MIADRADRAGLGVALALHVGLLAALTFGKLAPPLPPVVPAMEVEVVRDVSAAPMAEAPPSVEAAPPAPVEAAPPAPVEAPPAQAVAAPPPPPAPIAKPQPSPAKPVAKPAPVVAKPAPPKATAPKVAPAKSPSKVEPAAKAAPPSPAIAPKTPAKAPRKPDTSRQVSEGQKVNKVAPARSTRLGDDFLKGVSDRPSPVSRAAGPAVEAALARDVLRQLKPHWRAPVGPDADQLRTELAIALDRDGGVRSVRVIGTTGVTPSNRPQVRLHQEAAQRAVRLAAPFRLPADLYDSWKLLEPVGFDRRLSR